MTSPIAAFLNNLVGGAAQGYQFRAGIEDRKRNIRYEAEDREYEKARRLREEVGFGLQQRIGEAELTNLTTPHAPPFEHVTVGDIGYTFDSAKGTYTAGTPMPTPSQKSPEPKAINPGETLVGQRPDGTWGPLYRAPDKTPEQKPLQTIPNAGLESITGLAESLRLSKEALTAVTEHPEAFGLLNAIPFGLNDRVDQKGVDYRAPVSQLGSGELHRLLGSAMSQTELATVQGFIPRTKDPPDVVKSKVERLQKVLQAKYDELTRYYQGQGFAVPEGSGAPPMLRAPQASGGALPSLTPAQIQKAQDDPDYAAFLRERGYQ